MSSVLRTITQCRSCSSTELEPILRLGETPLANYLVPLSSAEVPERFPLNLVFCRECALAQIAEIVSPSHLFSDYPYFSSVSPAIVGHASEMAQTLSQREGLTATSLVIELASNDGYLLQFFKEAGIPVLGIEPAQNIARVAEERGIPTVAKFFGEAVARELAAEGKLADLMIGNNVLAHVPDLNDFVGGLKALLKPSGSAVFEFPYVKDMLDKVEFDTIYHEHQCYFSVTALRPLFERHGLMVFDVSRQSIHGGSLRLSVCHTGERPMSPGLVDLLAEEKSWSAGSAAAYHEFADRVTTLKRTLLDMLDNVKAAGSRVAAYGAAAKGVTLTSYCGIGGNYLDYVVDLSPHKQGFRFPIDGLPIYEPGRLCQDMPEYTLLLTWNFADEILRQQADYRSRGGRFIVPVPAPRVVA